MLYELMNMCDQLAKDACYQAAKAGSCQTYEPRWYYDTKEERCRQFYYSGCGGNDNNFNSEDECQNRCERKQETTASPLLQQPDEHLEPFRIEHCLLPSETGPCRALVPRYYYNSRDGVCDVFGYGGCQGNQNNFHSADECENKCGNIQDLCSLPPVRGRCQDNVTRYYYDSRANRCNTFEYSGCRGNKNNFYSARDCEARCHRQQTHSNPIDNTENVSKFTK